MKEYFNRIGEIYINPSGLKFTVIDYRNSRECDVEFSDGNIRKNLLYSDVKKGKIKNLYHPSFSNIGFIGEGIYDTSNNNAMSQCWANMLRRCYDSEHYLKQPTYEGCTVCEEWCNFQNFGEWYTNSYVEGFALDKDILVKGNKVYSPETCCFVPRQINQLFVKADKIRNNFYIGVRKEALTGRYSAIIYKYNVRVHIGVFNTPEKAFQAYKIAKEAYIKEVAELWKGKISDKVYKALQNYQVEPND